MAGELNLGYHLDVALGCVCHNLAALLLCVEVWAVGLACVVAAINAVGNPVVAACCTNGCEAWVFLYLEAPSLVIGEVPVETVELVVRHHVDYALYFIEPEEVAAHVEHETAVFKAGRINDAHHGQCILGNALILYTGHHIRRENLLDTLECIVETVGAVCADGNAAGGDVECVTLAAKLLATVVTRHGYERIGSLGLHLNAVACCVAEVLCELHRLGRKAIGQLACCYCETLRQNKCAAAHCHLLGDRGKVDSTVGHCHERQPDDNCKQQ